MCSTSFGSLYYLLAPTLERSWLQCRAKPPVPRIIEFMSRLHSLASEHARAICEEVGYRLGQALRADYADLPVRLQSLMHQIARLDCDAPSIAPSIEDIVRPQIPADAASETIEARTASEHDEFAG